MKNLLKTLASDRNGATAIEYSLIAAFIALALVGSLGGLKTALGNKFDSVATTVTEAGTK